MSPGLMPKQKKLRKARKPRPLARLKGDAKSAGAWFRKLVELQARLRAPPGCPWDIEQTHLSLRTYLSEEAYEVQEARESGDNRKLAEGLGDLLLQVVFHEQIANEEGHFSAADVVR